MILSNLTVPLVGLVDSTVIGHLQYSHQLGAVAVGASFYSITASMAGTLRMGTTGFTAQAAGQKDNSALKRICIQSICIAWLFAFLLAVIAMPLANLAFTIIGASAELTQQAKAFFQIRLLGLPAMLMQHAIVGWYLGTQTARVPMLIMIGTNISNIILVTTLVLGFGWGVEGAAIASVLAEWSGTLLGLILLRKRVHKIDQPVNWPELKTWSNWRPLLQANLDILLRTIALQCIFLSITMRGASLGDATVAANALLLNGLMVCSYAMDGLAHAVEALSGYAIGEGKKKSLARAMVIAGGWSLIVSFAFALIFALFGKYFIAMQTSMTDVRETANAFIPYLALLPIIAVWSFLLDGLFIGATKAREMRNTMALTVIATLPVALITYGFGNHGIWLMLLFFMAARGLIMGITAIRMERKQQWVPCTSVE